MTTSNPAPTSTPNKRPRSNNENPSNTIMDSSSLVTTTQPTSQNGPYNNLNPSPFRNGARVQYTSPSANRNNSTANRNTNVLPSVSFRDFPASSINTGNNVEATREKNKKENMVKIAQSYLQGLVATLPQSLGSLCKDTALKTLALTKDIDQRMSTLQKLDCNDPKSTPRAVNIKVILKAPDSHRETEVFKNKSAEFDALVKKFKADATNIMKTNAEDIVQTLKKERFLYLLEKTLTLGECFYVRYKLKNQQLPEVQLNLENKHVTEIAVRSLWSRSRNEAIHNEVATYLGLPPDEIAETVESMYKPQTFNTDAEMDACVHLVKVINENITIFLRKYVFTLKDIIEEGKNDKKLDTELTSIIEKSSIQKLTDEVEMDLEKEEHINAKQMEEIIKQTVEKKMKEQLKILTNRLAKNSLGGGKKPPSKPKNKSGKPTSTSNNSSTNMKEDKKMRKPPTKSHHKKKEAAKKTQSRAALNKDGRGGKKKKK